MIFYHFKGHFNSHFKTSAEAWKIEKAKRNSNIRNKVLHILGIEDLVFWESVADILIEITYNFCIFFVHLLMPQQQLIYD